jgi:hypothetical protein
MSLTNFPNGVSNQSVDNIVKGNFYDPTRNHVFFDDFDHYDTDMWSELKSAGGTVAISPDNPSCIRLTSNTGSNDFTGLLLGPAVGTPEHNFTLKKDRDFVMKFRWNPNGMNASDPAYAGAFMFTDDVQAGPPIFFSPTPPTGSVGVLFKGDPAGGTVCYQYVNNGSNGYVALLNSSDNPELNVASRAGYPNTFFTATIYYDSVKGRIKWILEDTLVSEVDITVTDRSLKNSSSTALSAADIPFTDSGAQVLPHIYVVNFLNSGAQSADFDYIFVSQPRDPGGFK